MEWLPYMLVGELILSATMRKQLRTVQCSVVSQLSTVGTDQALHLSWCTTCVQLINNLPAPILLNLTARKLSAKLRAYCVVIDH